MTILELERIDLEMLAEALEDHSPEARWWFDPATGETEPRFDGLLDDEAEDDFDERRLVFIDPIPSHESYEDMEDFIALVRDPRPRELLERAIGGRGAFRRFKDTLFEFPDLREAWFQFHDVRMERRALEWLADEGLIDRAVAEREVRARPDPDHPELGGPFDPLEIARRVTDDLRALYGPRLRQVRLFGSWARGDAHPESDIDLLVELDRVDSPWEELQLMDGVLWRHSYDNDTVISVVPVGEEEMAARTSPTIIRAADEGVALV